MHLRNDRRPRTPVPPRLDFDPLPPPETEFDHESPIRLSDEALAALLPDDDYEPMPNPRDFWIDAEN